MSGGPIRTCAGCRTRRPQHELMRVSRRRDGVVSVDAEGSDRSPGRGAYVCRDVSCVDRAIRSGGLRRALRLDGGGIDEIRAELLMRPELTGRERGLRKAEDG